MPMACDVVCYTSHITISAVINHQSSKTEQEIVTKVSLVTMTERRRIRRVKQLRNAAPPQTPVRNRWFLIGICACQQFHATTALQSRRGLSGRLFRSWPSTVARRMVLTTPESIIEQTSTPKVLDDLIDESVRTSARKPIMMQFDPSSGWIWKRWKGTVFSETWDSCVSKMAYAIVVFYVFQRYPGESSILVHLFRYCAPLPYRFI
jgi:hypothetical protein